MELIHAIRARHSVRKYSDKAIEPKIVETLRWSIDECNSLAGLHIQLVTDEPKAFASGLLKYGAFSGVKNYLVMAAPSGAAFEEKVGYYGERLVLLAQTLGLNSCWVGLTYKKIQGAFSLEDGEIVHCVIALGYGLTSGVQHPLKDIKNFYEAPGDTVPAWFERGIQAAVLAPTAINQQKFKFSLKGRNTVSVKTLFSMAGYTNIDLGIVKYHFEIAAGKENFTWE